ncbi:Lsr2 family DNA-binding protein [Streptomyces hebeiensis]
MAPAGRRAARRRGGGGTARPEPAPRAWAREQGFDVPDRGRIPAAVIDAYKQAQGK